MSPVSARRRRPSASATSRTTSMYCSSSGCSTAIAFRRSHPKLSFLQIDGSAEPASEGFIAETALCKRIRRHRAEGEGFEPSSDPRARNGFRDRRIRPLCHPSEGRTGYPPSGDGDVQLHAGCLVPGDGAVELVLPRFERDLQLGGAADGDQLRLVARLLD